MKKLFIGAVVLGWGFCLLAQESGFVVNPDADEFLGPTYALPGDPVFVETPESNLGNKNVLAEIFGSDMISLNSNQPVVPVQSKTFTPKPGMYYPKQSVLTKLQELPPPQLTQEPFVDTTITPIIKQTDFVDRLLSAIQENKRMTLSVPREIRISFHPGQSALSAQALKWIKVFSLKVRKDPRLVIEIRVSEQDWPLQSKRVALMLQAVMEQGVSRHQIFVYKTARSMDTVLLGYGQALDKEVEKSKKKQKRISW